MHQIEWGAVVVERGAKGKGVHLSCKAGLTNSIWLCFRVNFEASNQVLLYHLLHISIIVVYEVSVPEGEISRQGRDGESGL